MEITIKVDHNEIKGMVNDLDAAKAEIKEVLEMVSVGYNPEITTLKRVLDKIMVVNIFLMKHFITSADISLGEKVSSRYKL